MSSEESENKKFIVWSKQSRVWAQCWLVSLDDFMENYKVSPHITHPALADIN